MTREDMRRKAKALLDKAISAPRFVVGADDKAIAVSVRAVLDSFLANDFIDMVCQEHAKME